MTRVRSYELTFTPTRPTEVADDAVATALRVPPESAGMRLDRFVQSQLRRTSRTRTQLIIRVSAFSPDGRRLRASDRVRAEQHVMLWRAPWDEERVDEELPTLFEDAHYLAVDKPAMIPVHPTARYFRSTVVKILEAARPDERLFLSHRLDRETSGVLLLARTHDADRAVKRAFAGLDPRTGKAVAGRLIEKVYLAIARGWPERDRFRVEHALEEDPESRFRVKMRVTESPAGLSAATEFEVLERRARPGTGERYALLRCSLETGRQHQIRVHLAAEGLPIVGDKLYGPDDELFARGADGELTDDDLAALELPRHALHAHVLAMAHPLDPSTELRVESPLPADLAAFWEALGPGSR